MLGNNHVKTLPASLQQIENINRIALEGNPILKDNSRTDPFTLEELKKEGYFGEEQNEQEDSPESD